MMVNDDSAENYAQMHWLTQIIQAVDVGFLVLDKNYSIQMWNGFMENHSGLFSTQVLNKNLFDIYPDIPKAWFKKKIETVFLLKNRSFILWEQRPYLFHFKNYHSITGKYPHMFQNITISPVVSINGKVEHVLVSVYDVTDIVSELNEHGKTC